MTWSFDPADGGTLVTVEAENVPEGISPEDHQAGLNSTLENLAAWVRPRGDSTPQTIVRGNHNHATRRFPLW